MSRFNCRAEILMIALGAGVVVLGLGGMSAVTRGGGAEAVSVVQPEMEGGMEGMMEMMMKAATPGENHERLAYFIGEWDAEAVFTMPGTPPTVSSGVSVSTWELGERFVRTEFHVDDMMGMPFDGIGFMGYDNNSKKYQSTWIDTWGTAIFMETGAFSSADDSYTLSGVGSTPFGPMEMTHITRIIDNNTHVLEFWEPNPETGELAQSGTITYKRK